MVPLALVIRLLAGQCENENQSTSIDWPLAAQCAPPEHVQTSWALRKSLAQVQKNKRKNPGNREPNLVTEARVGGAEVGSTRVGVAVSAEESVRRSAAGTPVERRRSRREARNRLHLESDNCGGAVAGGNTGEGRVTPSSVRTALGKAGLGVFITPFRVWGLD